MVHMQLSQTNKCKSKVECIPFKNHHHWPNVDYWPNDLLGYKLQECYF